MWNEYYEIGPSILFVTIFVYFREETKWALSKKRDEWDLIIIYKKSNKRKIDGLRLRLSK